jgi:pimeloyl-ACP methyl ester carboxylesterase
VAHSATTQFATSDGLSIAYQVVGDGPIDLVFVPGFVSHVELNWEFIFTAAFLERLLPFSRLIIMDKRGSGLSDRTLGAGTLEGRMDDIRAVMDAAGVDRAALMGVSNGGPIASMFAASYPERVSSLVLCIAGCPGVQPLPADFEDTLRLVQEYWTTGLVLNTIVHHPEDPAEAVKQLARFERYACTAAVAVEILRRGSESDLRPFLPMVHAPTLVLSNRDDPVIPLEQAVYLAEHIPDCQHIVLDGDFHCSWRSADYDEILRLIQEFLTGQPAVAAPPADRVLSTIMFNDIVQSTDRAADLGDARWREVLDHFDEVCRHEVVRHQGVLVKHTGDGMVARFDSPGRAVSCALATNDQVGALGVRTRAGVHTGEVELRGSDLSGLAVHIASRVMDAASDGEVLVSRTVKDLTIGASLAFADRGEHRLKGVPGKWALFAAS